MKKLFFVLAFLSFSANSADFSTEEYLIGNPAPTVIVAHGCDGVNRFNKEWARQINSWGYNAVIVDSFSKRGKPNGVCNKGWEVHPVDRSNDLNSVSAHIVKQSWHRGKIGAIGFSHGGSTMIALSKDTNISALVAYYPSCSLTYPETKPTADILLHLGKKDTWTPIWQCSIQNLTDSRYTVKVYEDAGHAFDIDYKTRHFGNHILFYEPTADRESRQATKEFFDARLR